MLKNVRTFDIIKITTLHQSCHDVLQEFIMDKKLKQNLALITFGVILFGCVMHFGAVLSFAGGIVAIISPVLVGFILAFILDVPMRYFERVLNLLSEKLKSKKNLSTSSLRILSLCLTLICVLLVLVLVCTLVIPAIVSSVVSLYELTVSKWPEWRRELAKYNINTEQINTWINSIDLHSLLSKLGNGATSVISTVFTVVSDAVSGVTSFAISFILAIYVLLSKNELSLQSRRLMRAHLKSGVCDYIDHVARLMSDTFSKFLSGQCVECVILGVLVFLANAVCGVPYSALIGVLTGVLAFIPYVGAFGACVIGVFLVGISEPSKVLVCVVVYVVVQFVETQFIYPHVVGTSVGLSPLWTLVAVLVGGKLMGLVGMIFFIPMMAVAIQLLREHTEKKEKLLLETNNN